MVLPRNPRVSASSSRTEIERFLDETGIYTKKSEFIKEACRTHLRELNDDTAIAALRLEQLLAQAEQSRETILEIGKLDGHRHAEIHATFDDEWVYQSAT